MTFRSLAAAAWTAFILFACLAPDWWLPSGGGQTGEPFWLDAVLGRLPLDKIVHFGIFAIFGLLWRWAGATTRGTLLGGLAVSLLSELGQSIPFLERSSDLADLLADLAGLGASLLLCRPRRALAPGPAATT